MSGSASTGALAWLTRAVPRTGQILKTLVPRRIVHVLRSTPPPTASPTLASRAASLWRFTRLAIQCGCMISLVDDYIGGYAMTYGPSMLPTLNIAGDIVLVERISWRRRRLALGDVVVCISPLHPSRLVCKRILGLPGDIICKDPRQSNPEWIKIPKGTVWIQGDNFENSRDSREFGPVPMGLIRGHVLCRIFPSFKYPFYGAELASADEIASLHVENSGLK
ncbi:hypothetical protein BSLG_002645 [Batrachochytrium salamandrivorans]|nr:hypothetical protein BASA60_010886 [Batrachochytrium salamandrivorans]KAH6577383.1 hypothetical protein BASA62_000920 [Batrachochytrium salamandrivorans]KAH9252558.1 hypothetical protein BASA81_009517 [Batrachochytrium salamandrivorans]KAJ1342826.1 hypothetical protein BSLG_002645 [Batrachochytrium salamandrivorans]